MLAQHLALVVLGSRGAQPIGDLTEHLAVNIFTMTQHRQRIEHRALVRRDRSAADRPMVLISLTDAGSELLCRIIVARRPGIDRVLNSMPPQLRQGLLLSLREVSEAAGEVPEQGWAQGWGCKSHVFARGAASEMTPLEGPT